MNPILVLEDVGDFAESGYDQLARCDVPAYARADLAELREMVRGVRAKSGEVLAKLERGPDVVQVDFETCPECHGVGSVRHLLFWWRPCPKGCTHGRVRV